MCVKLRKSVENQKKRESAHQRTPIPDTLKIQSYFKVAISSGKVTNVCSPLSISFSMNLF